MHTAQEPGRAVSGALAFLVHLLFFGFLFFGISWQKKVVAPVEVDLWQDLPEPPVHKTAPPEPVKPEPKPVVKKEPPPPPPPKVVEPPKPSPAEIELKEKQRRQKEEEDKRLQEQKKAEAEKRRLEEEQKQAEAEQKRVEAEQKRLETEKLKREEEERRAEEQKRVEEQRRVEEAKREEDRRERAAAMERERQQQEAVRKQREAEETKRRADAAVRAAQDKLVADYVARIKARVQSRVVLPPNIDGNPEAVFDVVLIPGGEVLSTALRKSSGNQAYDAAVERAIMAAQPLPVPSEPDLFQDRFREIALKFRPRE